MRRFSTSIVAAASLALLLSHNSLSHANTRSRPTPDARANAGAVATSPTLGGVHAKQNSRTEQRRQVAGLFKKIKRGVKKVGRKFKKAGRKVKRGFKKAGRGIKRGFKKAGRGFKKVGRGFKKVGRKIGKGLKKAGKWVKKNWMKLLPPPLPMIIRVVKTFGKFIKLVAKHGFKGALKALWKEFKAKVKRGIRYVKSKLKKVFQGFRRVLVMKKYSLKKIERFARSTANTARKLLAKFHRTIGLPFLLGEIVAWSMWPVVYSTTLAAVTPLASINFGFRKLMAWLIPKIILGAGGAFRNVRHKKGGKLFAKIAKSLLKFAGAGGGLLLSVVKNPSTKARIRRIFVSIANVSGKIEQGINNAMGLVKRVRTASFEQVDAALGSVKPMSAKLSSREVVRLVEGLMDFANEQIWLKLSPILRKVLTKALSLMDRLIDIPRNALVGAVGTIPFAGGALASALNFGLGFIVDMVKNFFVNNVMKLAKTLLDDTMGDIKKSVSAKLKRSRNLGKRGSGFLALVQTVGKLAGDVKKQMRRASQGLRGTIGGLVATALDKFLLRGITDSGVRQVISRAVSMVVSQITKQRRGGIRLSLTDAAIRVLRSIKDPLSRLIAGKVKNRSVAGIVQSGLATLIGRLANRSGVRQLMKNPTGFLGELGAQFLQQNKGRLVGLLTKGKAWLTNLAGGVVDALGDIVRRGGLRGLLRANELIGVILSATQSLVISRIPEPFRGIVQKAFDKVAPKLRTAEGRRWLVTQGPRAIWNSLVVYLKGLFERAKSFARSKLEQVRVAIFSAINAVQNAANDASAALRELTNLGNVVRGMRLPAI